MSIRSPMDRLDPELAAALAAMQRPTRTSYALESIPAMREASMALLGSDPMVPNSIVHTTHVAAGSGTQPDIPISVRTPAGSSGGLPGMLWIHGGGYITGSIFQPAPRLDRWCTEVGCVVVSVEYRLAPEHPYPAPLDDCYLGLLWTIEHAEELGIDPDRLVIVGASAGGGLAAALTLLARDRKVEPPAAGSLLIYPMIDDRNVVVGPSDEDTPIWNHQSNRLGWRAYLGPVVGEQDPSTRDIEPYAATARATDLAELPPTFIGVGTIDIFCAENIHYAAALVEAGVSVELHVHPGAHHGFEGHAPEAAIVRRFGAEIANWLGRAMSAPRGI